MKDFFEKLWNTIWGFLISISEKMTFIPLPAETIAWILVGLAGLIVLLVIVLVIGICSSKRKDKKADKVLAQEKLKQETNLAKAQAVLAEKEEKAQPTVVEQPVASTPVEEVKTEPVVEKTVEEKPAVEKVKEEKPQPAKAEVKATAKKTVAKAPAQKKAPAEKVEKVEEKKPAKKLAGKWKIVIKRDNEYVAELTASNGEIMLISETYSTAEGARNGISTIIKGVETGNFVIYRDKAGNYYFKLKSANNRLLCIGAVYKEKTACIKASESVKRIAKDSPIVPGVVEGERYVDYTPAKVNLTGKGGKGKWKIEVSEDGGFSAKLYANNGQLMLATEEVSAKKTAKTAIESVKKNCAEGNFIIDKDKFGRFCYKLHNSQKSVLCIGEAYETLEGCVSAIESVRRFAATAELAE